MKNKGVIITLIIIVIILLAETTYLYLSTKKEINTLNKRLDKTEEKLNKANKINKRLKKEKEIQEKQVEDETTCSGLRNAIYYGKSTKNNIPLEMTITLNSNGTYLKEIKNSEGERGTYEISNNKISLTHRPPLAPDDVEEEINTYDISSDCKTIKYIDSYYDFELILK